VVLVSGSSSRLVLLTIETNKSVSLKDGSKVQVLEEVCLRLQCSAKELVRQ
jgi:hypothetical protein